MKQKGRSIGEIIRILQQADGGQTAPEVYWDHNVSEIIFHRWKCK
jgi:hypothetical protein